LGQKKEHVDPNATVIYSTDIAENNPEFVGKYSPVLIFGYTRKTTKTG